jgi:hypothetical protein
MLLRSVSHHVRNQNWVAVALDLVIVVIGVFIGIQVANWNEDRLNQREEQVLIERLKVDFDRIRQDADQSLAFHREMHASMQTVVQSVRSGSLKDEDIPSFERALILGVAFQTSADHSGTFTELMSSGRANILRDRDLVDELVDYEDFLGRYAFAQSYYIDMAMSAMGPYTSAFSYGIDLRLTEEIFDLSSKAPVYYDFNTIAADEEFENAAEHLMFVHSGFVLWRSRISDRVDAIHQRLTEAAASP